MKKSSKKNSLALASAGIHKALGSLLPEISSLIESARHQAIAAANLSMVSLYWNIGRLLATEVIEFSERAQYGQHVLREISSTLVEEYGSGYSPGNLWDMRRFYAAFEIVQTLSEQSSRPKAIVQTLSSPTFAFFGHLRVRFPSEEK